MKRILGTAVLSMALSLSFMGCGQLPENAGSLGGNLSIARGLLDQNISHIQIIVLNDGAGRKVSELLKNCQAQNLVGNGFSKSDLVTVYNDGEEKYFRKEVTAAELENGTKLKVELETGTNYVFLVELIGTANDGTMQVISNASATYPKVSKGDNKALNVTLNILENPVNCSVPSPLIE